MKPANFPSRKLLRRLRAHDNNLTANEQDMLDAARQVRTKIRRTSRRKTT